MLTGEIHRTHEIISNRGDLLDKIEIIMRKWEEGRISETVLVSFNESESCSIVPEVSALTFPGLDIYIKEQSVYRDHKLVPLTHREFLALLFLARHPGWVFTADQIYEAVWREPDGNGNTAVANIIGQIRRKLTPDTPKGGYICTVIGSGYKFEVPK